MKANARLSIVLLSFVTSVGCAASSPDEPERKPRTRGATAGASPYDYTQNPYSGWGGQPAKEGGATSSGGSGGSGGRADGGGGSSAAGAGMGGTGASNLPAVTCPSLTVARASNGSCVPRVTEYDVAAKPASIVLGSDGRIWVDDEGRDELLQLDDSGQIIGRVSCEAGSAPRALAGGAGDVALWYTSAAAQTLVKVYRSGDQVAIPLGFEASAIAVAPSGDLYLSESQKAVYRLPRDQATPTRWQSSPTDVMVVSGDDAVWFSQGTVLGRVSPDRGLEDYFLGDTFNACGLSLGPDTELWFSDCSANQLVQVRDGSPNLVLNLPTGTTPTQLILGPDRAFWFTEAGPRMLGRATLSGEITHYPLPTPGGMPRAIVVGSDGNIWFTTFDSRKVGRLIPDAAP